MELEEICAELDEINEELLIAEDDKTLDEERDEEESTAELESAAPWTQRMEKP